MGPLRPNFESGPRTDKSSKGSSRILLSVRAHSIPVREPNCEPLCTKFCSSTPHCVHNPLPEKQSVPTDYAAPKMLTRFITDVTAKFNPFSAKARTARLFISFLPPNVRTDGMNISTKLLPRNSTEPSSLYVKFSKSPPSSVTQQSRAM